MSPPPSPRRRRASDPLGAALAVLALGAVVWARAGRSRRRDTFGSRGVARAERATWRMPRLALPKPATWSPQAKLAMAGLLGYLGVSVLLLIVKAAQSAAG